MVPRAPFGRTGHDSSRVIFGAAAIFQLITDHGIHHVDVAAGYGNGRAGMNLAP
jgi:aryl-alcohol dehydrogenase-like predicted oxidoreductase